jgi:xanthine dehydrogenase molybdenum-binding subunit
LSLELLMRQSEEHRNVGADLPREDTPPKVRGALKYVDDLKLDGMVYGKVVRSDVPHAVVRRVDVTRAMKLRGVLGVITPFDVPQHRFTRHFTYVPWKEIRDRRILEARVRYVGDPVAAVAALDPYTAEEAAERIEVDYQELPAVFSADESLEAGSPLIHDEIEVGGELRKLSGNVPYTEAFEDGDRERAYSECAKTYESTFRTQALTAAPIEKRTIIASPTPLGGLEVWCSTQSIHGLRYCLSQALKMPLSHITVHDSLIGGGFGVKYNMAMHEPIAAHLAIKVGKPLKMTLTREEDFTNGGRRPVKMDVKMGVSSDGIIKAMEMDAVLQSGAYDDHIVGAVSCLGGWFFSMYRAKYKRYKGLSVYTNLPVYSAMRGFLNPQQNFAVESFADEISEDLGIDPLEFRLKNIPVEGDIFYGQGFTVATRIRSNGLRFLLQEGARRIGWPERAGPVAEGNQVRAIGFAWGSHCSGTGGEMLKSPDRVESTGSIVKVNEDGSVNVVTGMVDHGAGTHEVFRKVCADALGVNLSDVHVSLGTTDTVPFDTGTHACRGSFVGGWGVLRAAEQAKGLLLAEASGILGLAVESLDARDGFVFSKVEPNKRVSVAEAALRAKTRGGGLIFASSRVRPDASPPSFVACFAEVVVDKETGVSRVSRVVMGADVGTVVNPRDCAAQIHGGLAFGIGMALYESMIYDKGRIRNSGYLDYMIPRAPDLPPIETFFADTYEPKGPYGIKGIGEASADPVASAIANAVCRAAGKRFTSLPLRPESVVASFRADVR